MNWLWKVASCVIVANLAWPAAAATHDGRHDGEHDFDFDLGLWKTETSRLMHPLHGANDWIEMVGTTRVSKLWNGRANLAEFESDGPNGHLTLLALRLYKPEAHQWSISFATPYAGTIGVPLVGEFKDGQGEFYDAEPHEGRQILVHFSFFALTPDTARSEQAFSDDGGKTWETNWINRYTRIK